jgi:hypothetical protein
MTSLNIQSVEKATSIPKQHELKEQEKKKDAIIAQILNEKREQKVKDLQRLTETRSFNTASSGT